MEPATSASTFFGSANAYGYPKKIQTTCCFQVMMARQAQYDLVLISNWTNKEKDENTSTGLEDAGQPCNLIAVPVYMHML